MKTPMSKISSVFKRKNRVGERLVEGSLSKSLILSLAIIVSVQLIFLTVLFFFTRIDINERAAVTADELEEILQEPLYNIDNVQVKKIADVLIASGRVSGLKIVSSATGPVFNTLNNDSESLWIQEQRREIFYRDIFLGYIVLQLNETDFRETIQFHVIITIVLVLMVLFANIWANHRFVHVRVRKVFGSFEEGLNRIQNGLYDHSLSLSGYSDVDAIIIQINSMAKEVHKKNRELMEINSTLESRVRERTSELESSLSDLNRLQDRLVEAGKLSVLGQLSAGIAHEFNTPLGAIISTSESLSEFIDNRIRKLVEFPASLDSSEKNLYLTLVGSGFQKNRVFDSMFIERGILRNLTEQLNREGVADARQTANLLTNMGIHDRVGELIPLLTGPRCLEIVQFAADVVDARRMLAVIQEAARRAASVVSAFRQYLAPESRELAIKMNADNNLRQVLILMQNNIKKGIKVITNFGDLYVTGIPDKLNQVWINLIRNAIQAMDGCGVLEIVTRTEGSVGVVRVIDSGKGIPDQLQPRIFEPFVTTRESGEGMGLGLDICKRIVEDMGGTIEFVSKSGRTEFIVKLPVN